MVFSVSTASHKRVFVNWNGGISTSTATDGSFNTLELDAVYAHSLGLQHGQIVNVEFVENVGIPQSVAVEPVSEDDWEIIVTFVEFHNWLLKEQNAGIIEEIMLQQVSVVAQDQPFVIYLHGSLPISLTTDCKTDNICYLLQADVELHVAPKVRKRSGNPETIIDGPIVFRIREGDIEDFEIGIFDGFLPGTIVQLSSISRYPIRANSISYIYLKVKEVDHIGTTSVVSGNTLKALGLEPFSKVMVKSVVPPKHNSVSITFTSVDGPTIHTDTTARKILKNLVEEKSVVITSGALMALSDTLFRVSLSFETPTTETFVVFDKSNISKLEITVRNGTIDIPETINHPKIVGRTSFIETLKKEIDLSLSIYQEGNCHGSCVYLIHGMHGMGKTQIMKHLKQQYSKSAYTIFEDCMDLVSEANYDILWKSLTKLSHALVLNQPSVLILDDVEILISHAVHFPGILKIVYELFTSPSYQIVSVISTQNMDRLDAQLLNSLPFFRIFEMPALVEQERKEILEDILGKDFEGVQEIAERTDGYLPEDFQQLIQDAKRISYLRYSTVSILDMRKAIETFAPSSLMSAHIEKPKTKWSDIGGIFDAKRDLLKSVQWPLKFHTYYKEYKFNPKSGCLIYGPPGCGKSFIVPALANECNLNLISVKGPELLDKYIGTSEESIRNLFQRARLAAPCLLFFDEFDAISTRRYLIGFSTDISGSDNAGTTDRMVNQLLTELDGADELEGVVVIGATSRPQVIDPALLRPGRLDTRVYIGFPTFEERLDILSICGRDVENCDELLKEIAAETGGWTGADLQAIFSNAKMELAEEMMDEGMKNVETGGPTRELMHINIPVKKIMDLKKIENELSGLSSQETTKKKKNVPRITAQHILEGKQKTKPSLTDSKRREYERLYKSFKEGRHEDIGTEISFA